MFCSGGVTCGGKNRDIGVSGIFCMLSARGGDLEFRDVWLGVSAASVRHFLFCGLLFTSVFFVCFFCFVYFVLCFAPLGEKCLFSVFCWILCF